MSTTGGGGVWFLDAQEVIPEARTTAARSVRVTFISMDLSMFRVRDCEAQLPERPFSSDPTAANP